MWYVSPMVILMYLVAIVAMGYMLIKMTCIVPNALIFLDIMGIATIICYIQLVFALMGNIESKSADFLKALELRGDSSCRRREVKSCKHLQAWAGSYFVMRKTTRVKIFELMVYYTMSLVISV